MIVMPIISHPQVRTTGEAVNGATYPPPRPEQAVSLAASLVEDSDDAIVGKTLDGRVFSWNGGAERLFGYRATEIKRLQSLVLETAERVQRRIGQDLHDGLSQQLSGIAYLAHVLLRKLESHARPEAEEAGRIVELISEATEQARAVARGLLPVKPEPQGLVEALRGLARSVERTYPLTCWFFGDADLGLPDPTLATHLYRIAQEAVHNAVKHGHASQVTIHLQAVRGRLRLIVQDDGYGWRPSAVSRNGLGMQTMRYRAGAIGATLRWRARPGHGLRVVCSLPLPGSTRCLAAQRLQHEPAAAPLPEPVVRASNLHPPRFMAAEQVRPEQDASHGT